MPHTSSPPRPSEPFRYPAAQEAEWRMLVAEAQAALAVSRWALGLGAVALLILLAIVVGLVV
jgi:hypothetical protein